METAPRAVCSHAAGVFRNVVAECAVIAGLTNCVACDAHLCSLHNFYDDASPICYRCLVRATTRAADVQRRRRIVASLRKRRNVVVAEWDANGENPRPVIRFTGPPMADHLDPLARDLSFWAPRTRVWRFIDVEKAIANMRKRGEDVTVEESDRVIVLRV